MLLTLKIFFYCCLLNLWLVLTLLLLLDVVLVWFGFKDFAFLFRWIALLIWSLIIYLIKILGFEIIPCNCFKILQWFIRWERLFLFQAAESSRKLVRFINNWFFKFLFNFHSEIYSLWLATLWLHLLWLWLLFCHILLGTILLDWLLIQLLLLLYYLIDFLITFLWWAQRLLCVNFFLLLIMQCGNSNLTK